MRSTIQIDGEVFNTQMKQQVLNTAIITGSFSHSMQLHCQTVNTRKRGFAEMMKERGKDGQYNNTNNSGLYRVTTQSKHFKGLLDLTCNFIFLQTFADIILWCLITTHWPNAHWHTAQSVTVAQWGQSVHITTLHTLKTTVNCITDVVVRWELHSGLRMD